MWNYGQNLPSSISGETALLFHAFVLFASYINLIVVTVGEALHCREVKKKKHLRAVLFEVIAHYLVL